MEEKKEMPKTEAKATNEQSAPVAKKSGKGWKIALGILGGCLVLLIIAAVVGFLLVKKGVKTVENNINEWASEFENANWTLEEESITWEDNLNVATESGKVGQTLKNDEFALTVNSIKYQDAIGGYGPFDGYQYMIVNLTYENLSKENTIIYSTDVLVTDAMFNEYYPFLLGAEEVDKPLVNMQNLPAGESLTGNYVFEIMSNSEDMNFKIMNHGDTNLEVVVGNAQPSSNANSSNNQ